MEGDGDADAERLRVLDAEALDDSDADAVGKMVTENETEAVAVITFVAVPEAVGTDREAEVDCVEARLMLLVPINVIEADAEGPVREALMVTDSVAVRLSV